MGIGGQKEEEKPGTIFGKRNGRYCASNKAALLPYQRNLRKGKHKRVLLPSAPAGCTYQHVQVGLQHEDLDGLLR